MNVDPPGQVIDLDGKAVITVAGPSGRVEIHHTDRSEAGKFALGGGGVGLVAGTLWGGPVLGLVAGVTAGAIKGKHKERLRPRR